LLRGERDQNETFGKVVALIQYQIAPGGARSKRHGYRGDFNHGFHGWHGWKTQSKKHFVDENGLEQITRIERLILYMVDRWS